MKNSHENLVLTTLFIIVQHTFQTNIHILTNTSEQNKSEFEISLYSVPCHCGEFQIIFKIGNL